MKKEDIQLKLAVVHILDSNLDMPILSDNLIDLNEDITKFIKAHISKVFTSDDLKESKFISENSYVITQLKAYTPDKFIDISKNLASFLFKLMKQHVNIPSADILFAIFEFNNENYLAILKMNYKSSFIHTVTTNNSETSNTIIKQKTVLPSENQKLEEAVIINLKNYLIELIEKKFLIDATKDYYLSKYYLECKWDFSPRTKLQILSKTIDDINKKYYGNDYEAKVEVKQKLSKEIESDGNLNLANISDKIYDNSEIQSEFKDKLEKYNFTDDTLVLQHSSSKKKIERQKIKTDNGIELNIPVDLYNNDVEFQTNLDGTITIVIRNINQLK